MYRLTPTLIVWVNRQTDAEHSALALVGQPFASFLAALRATRPAGKGWEFFEAVQR